MLNQEPICAQIISAQDRIRRNGTDGSAAVCAVLSSIHAEIHVRRSPHAHKMSTTGKSDTSVS